jgi:hypothetical protein
MLSPQEPIKINLQHLEFFNFKMEDVRFVHIVVSNIHMFSFRGITSGKS